MPLIQIFIFTLNSVKIYNTGRDNTDNNYSCQCIEMEVVDSLSQMTVRLCNLKILYSRSFCSLIVNTKQAIVEGMKAGCTCIEVGQIDKNKKICKK